jgi:hypothetical protein
MLDFLYIISILVVFYTGIIALAIVLKALFIFSIRLFMLVLIILEGFILLYFIFLSYYISSLYRITEIIYALAAIETVFGGEFLIVLLKDLRKLAALRAFPIITFICFLKVSLGFRWTLSYLIKS